MHSTGTACSVLLLVIIQDVGVGSATTFGEQRVRRIRGAQVRTRLTFSCHVIAGSNGGP